MNGMSISQEKCEKTSNSSTNNYDHYFLFKTDTNCFLHFTGISHLHRHILTRLIQYKTIVV